jgi:hypothetical protein
MASFIPSANKPNAFLLWVIESFLLDLKLKDSLIVIFNKFVALYASREFECGNVALPQYSSKEKTIGREHRVAASYTRSARFFSGGGGGRGAEDVVSF